MFGKPRDIDDTDTLDSSAIDGFFGDEAAAEQIVEVHELRHRVEQVESQISSQFTSLATYAQIAQEQVELARSEAKATTERSEQRITSLIERERADRIASFTGQAPAGTAPSVTARIDALEHHVAQIRKGLDECLQRQKALAEAIATMFEHMAPARTVQPATVAEPTTAAVEDERSTQDVATVDDDDVATVISFAPMTLEPPTTGQAATAPLSGPIADLSLEA